MSIAPRAIQHAQSDKRVARAIYQTEHGATGRAIRHAQSDKRVAREPVTKYCTKVKAQNVKSIEKQYLAQVLITF